MDWIERGLRFECQPDCGKCCSNEREGTVYLEPVDIERLARHHRASAQEFASRYTRTDFEGDIELAKTPDGNCVFLENERCSVYAARPLQCRAYPFLPLDGYTPIESPFSWRHEQAFCPGIGKGRLYSKREIRAILRGRREAKGFAV